MFAPDITYRYIYPIDSAGPTFEILSRVLNNTDTSGTIVVELTGIPKNKVLVLSNASLFADPGAAQTLLTMDLSGLTAAGALFPIVTGAPDVVAKRQALNWSGAAYIPGRGDTDPSLRLTAVFDLGVAGNFAQMSVHGVVIPRGNASSF